MNDLRTTSQPVADDQRAKDRPSPRRRGVRIVLIAIGFALACYLAYGIGKFSAGLKQVARPVVAREADSTEFDPLAAALPLAGPWSFDELDWNLRSQAIEKKEINALFTSLAASPPATTDAQLPDTDQKIIDLIAALNVRPTEQLGNQIFRLERSDLKAQLVARKVAGQTKTATFAIAYPQNGSTWQLYEFIPRPTGENTKSDTISAAPHLLPLPAAARRSGGRFADDGHVLLELVSLDASAAQLLAIWKDAGWEVRPSGLAGADDFSFLCARGEDVIYAWSADPADSLQNLMLVRTATPLDTSP
jgi:hypothetical protein